MNGWNTCKIWPDCTPPFPLPFAHSLSHIHSLPLLFVLSLSTCPIFSLSSLLCSLHPSLPLVHSLPFNISPFHLHSLSISLLHLSPFQSLFCSSSLILHLPFTFFRSPLHTLILPFSLPLFFTLSP